MNSSPFTGVLPAIFRQLVAAGGHLQGERRVLRAALRSEVDRCAKALSTPAT